MDALGHLLRRSPSREAIASLDVWLARLEACPFVEPLDAALWAGFEADRLGYAFVGGYHAALGRLLAGAFPAGAPSPLPSRLSLAATEAGGAHPSAIATKLSEEPDGRFRLDGEKTFATLASVAEEILVVASLGPGDDGKNQLRLVRLATGARGVTIAARAPTPFAPEIPHAKVTLANVIVGAADILPGDGYARYLKPFRTIEDTHVLAATLGYLIRVAQVYAFDRVFVEHVVALSLALRGAAAMSPDDPGSHLALAGVFDALRRLVADHDAEWTRVDDAERERWRRDLGLLLVADGVRRKRTEAAWKTLGKAAESI